MTKILIVGSVLLSALTLVLSETPTVSTAISATPSPIAWSPGDAGAIVATAVPIKSTPVRIETKASQDDVPAPIVTAESVPPAPTIPDAVPPVEQPAAAPITRTVTQYRRVQMCDETGCVTRYVPFEVTVTESGEPVAMSVVDEYGAMTFSDDVALMAAIGNADDPRFPRIRKLLGFVKKAAAVPVRGARRARGFFVGRACGC